MAKTCSRCREPKRLDEFNRETARPDGLQAMCRSCSAEASREWYAEHREAKKQQSRTWKAEHAEEARRYDTEYHRRYRRERSNG